ncbi:MAG: hypothetical protein E7603_04215 [Ruminococcaceae bacterium]|nr:hypothetical protein [Oscillospiraceae bacterium]
MHLKLLLWAVLLPIPFCVFRKKKYDISWKQLLLIYVIVSFMGAIGACFGSVISGGAFIGVRLYGLMMFDTVTLVLLHYLLKLPIGKLGDFISVPIMMVCASSKISCYIGDCCYGMILYYNEGQPVRFPSALAEMGLWILLTAFLLLIEHRGKAKNLMWPIALIWFGVVRFSMDYFRGPASERAPFVFSLTYGRFWSLIVFIMGLVLLYIALRKTLERNPKIKEYVKAIFGI